MDTKIAVIARRPYVALQFRYQFRTFCGIEPAIINALTHHWIPESEVEPNRLSYEELDFTKLHEHLLFGGLIQSLTPWPNLADDERQEFMSALVKRQRTGFKLFAENG